MRPTSAFISGMATMGVLAGGIVLGTGIAHGSTDDATTNAAGTSDTSSGATSSDTAASGSATATDSSAANSAVTDGTFTGDVVDTRYGPMQVEIVISDGKISSATTLQTPGSDPTSVQINDQVVPILIQATTDYQSVRFGNVSRATISTNAYKESAQSALDQAGFTG